MKNSITNLLGVMAVTVLSVSFAHATVITFEGNPNTQFGDEITGNGLAVGSDGGYSFTSSGDHFHFYSSVSFGPSNGTDVLAEDRDYSITMSRAGGGSFNLLGTDFAGNPFGVGGFGAAVSASDLLITGFFTGGGSISVTLNNLNTLAWGSTTFSGFDNLSSVTFDGLQGGSFSLDNINVNANANAVPEPASLALLALGLAGLGFSRRKQV